MKNTRVILFDLDGTLTDPKEGITKCIAYALQELRVEVPAELDWCIGPPLHRSLAEILADRTDLSCEEAVRLFRVRYSEVGLLENFVYAGIPETLAALVDHDYRLFLATSKPQVFAEKILSHFGLRSFFTEVYGSELDGTRADKAELISYVLTQENLDPQKCHMIGDTKYDIAGARQNGMSASGVLWGYGSELELSAENPSSLFRHPSEIKEMFAR